MNLVELYNQQVGMTRQIREGIFCADLSDDESLWQPQPNVSPIAWHYGHLAATEAFLFLGCSAGQWEEIPEEWYAWFKMGVSIEEIVDDLAPVSVLREAAQQTQAKSAAWIQSASEEVLAAPFAHDRAEIPRPSFLKAPKHCLKVLAIHESHHNGEISLLRRLMGKEPFPVPID